MFRLVMIPQEVPAEIAVKIPPHRVNVVGTVLDIVVLDQKPTPLDAVVVGLAGL